MQLDKRSFEILAKTRYHDLETRDIS